VYLNAKARAHDTTAKSNIRAVVLAAEVYAVDNDGTRGDADGRRGTTGYRGMTMALLRRYDAALAPTAGFHGRPTTTSYCARDQQGGTWWSARGPGISSLAFKQNHRCR
jgi:hypothetical protein